MNLYITQQGHLRFADGAPFFELTGWTVRAGYSLNDANMLQGATVRGLSRDEAIKIARRAIGKQSRYNLAA
jgi:hypothetical protein